MYIFRCHLITSSIPTELIGWLIWLGHVAVSCARGGIPTHSVYLHRQLGVKRSVEGYFTNRGWKIVTTPLGPGYRFPSGACHNYNYRGDLDSTSHTQIWILGMSLVGILGHQSGLGIYLCFLQGGYLWRLIDYSVHKLSRQ